jgi:hypothetical protein
LFTGVHAVSSRAFDSAAQGHTAYRCAKRVSNAWPRGVVSRATAQCNFDRVLRIAVDHIGIAGVSHVPE